jgi:hypothetical protein
LVFEILGFFIWEGLGLSPSIYPPNDLKLTPFTLAIITKNYTNNLAIKIHYLKNMRGITGSNTKNIFVIGCTPIEAK